MRKIQLRSICSGLVEEQRGDNLDSELRHWILLAQCHCDSLQGNPRENTDSNKVGLRDRKKTPRVEKFS